MKVLQNAAHNGKYLNTAIDLPKVLMYSNKPK